MTRSENCEQQFFKRYNRKVVVHREVIIEKDVVVQSNVIIEYRGNKFLIREDIENGMTKSVEVKHNGSVNGFKTHLEAETFIADKIGEI